MHLSKPITKQECIPEGCVPSAGVAVCQREGVSACQGSVSARGCLPARGVCLPEGGGVCLVFPRGVSGRHPPWTEFLTHACENITFLQLRLQTVTRSLLADMYGLPSEEV